MQFKMGLFGSYHAKVLKECKELNAELNKLSYNLENVKKVQPKVYNTLEIRLRDIVHDIGKALMDISLSDGVIDELVKFRAKFSSLKKRFF